MVKSTIVVSFLIFAGLAASQTCPELPETGVEIGTPVPIRPQDIPSGCSDYEILVARGTSEPNYEQGGKFGIVVGDPVVSNVTKILPGARGYPVQYPASSAIISGTITGARDVVSRLQKQSTLCPNQTFALVGYSQGAGVMHRAAEQMPKSLFSKIKAVVMFGDPSVRFSDGAFPSELQPKVRENCAPGDPVCDSGSCTYYHLVYIRPEWINPTVDFITKAFTGRSR